MLKNILIIHDISGFGKCSTTVALPILSSMELATTVLPTSLLSTHTAPIFEDFTFLDLKDEMPKITNHWRKLGLSFDAIYIGYLGSIEQIQFLRAELPKLLKADGKIYLDPVMADDGDFYYGFDLEYAKAMRQLCEIADVIMPNQTEASFLYNLPYQEGLWNTEQLTTFKAAVAENSQASIVLTGAGFDGDGKTGAYYFNRRSGEEGIVQSEFVGAKYHGTGDIFGSILVGALENGASLLQATTKAVDILPKIIKHSLTDPNMERNGLQFEDFLGDLSVYARELKGKK